MQASTLRVVRVQSMSSRNIGNGWYDRPRLATFPRMPDLDTKLAHERDRLIQQLAGLCDALMGATSEQLAEVLPVVGGVDAMVERVRKLGVVVPTEYPEADSSPIDPALVPRLLAGSSILRNN